MRRAFQEKELTECIRRHLPDIDGSISFQRIPTGKFNDSFFVCSGQGDFVLRIAPPEDSVFVFYERDMMRQEPGIHARLLRETSVPVAEIVAYDDSRQIVERDYMIMKRLPGEALTHAPGADEDQVLRQVGKCLAEVHRLTAHRYGYLGEHAPMQPQPTWRRAFEIMWHKLIADVRATGHYDESECDRLSALLEDHLPLFDRDVPASLLHMDVWAQNILVDEEGNLTGLVDWDRALWGDPEIEFAVLDYCDVSKPAFWEGYGRERDESTEARVRNIFYLLYEIQKYIVIREGRQNDSEGARWYKRHVMQILDRHFGR